MAKLRAARDRSGNLGGPERGPERYPADVVKLAKRKLSLRKIGERPAEAEHLNANGQPFAAQSVRNMIG